jgi:hypothetical protein
MRYSSTYIVFEDTHTTSTTTVFRAHKNLWPVSSDLHGRLGFRWTMSWTAWWRRRWMRCPEQPESHRHWQQPWGLPAWRWTTRCSRYGPIPSGGYVGACHTQRLMRPRRTAFRGRTGSRQASSRRRWAMPTWAPPASGVCSWFPSKKHRFILGVGLWKWLTSQIHGKILWRINAMHAKKMNLSWKHYSNKRNCMQGS